MWWRTQVTIDDCSGIGGLENLGCMMDPMMLLGSIK
jgi:hypothetical protein